MSDTTCACTLPGCTRGSWIGRRGGGRAHVGLDVIDCAHGCGAAVMKPSSEISIRSAWVECFEGRIAQRRGDSLLSFRRLALY